MKIQTVKIQTYNNEFVGYLVNTNIFFPKENCELIKEWLKTNEPEPEFTEEELNLIEVNRQTSEATQYLSDTDWVETYKLRHDLGLELIPEESSKWVIINKREEYKLFLKNLEGGN